MSRTVDSLKRKRNVIECETFSIERQISENDHFGKYFSSYLISCYNGSWLIVKCIRKLYEDQILCDVTFLLRDNKHFKAHRVVLAAANRYFHFVWWAMAFCTYGHFEPILSILYIYNSYFVSHNSFLSGLMLSGMSESEKDIITLQDTDPTLFKFVLDYTYGVVLEVSSNQIIPLLGLANCFSMDGLRER